MQQSTPQQEQLSTQMSVEEHRKQNSTLIDYESVPGTPFMLVHQDEKWFLAMGEFRITENTDTKEEQFEKLEKEKWLIVMHTAIICQKKAKLIDEISTKEEPKKIEDRQFL